MFKLSPLAAILAIAAVQGATTDLTSLSAAYSSVLSHVSSAASDLSVAAAGFSAAQGTAGASSFIQSDLRAFVSILYQSASGVIGSGLDFTAGVGEIEAMATQITNMLDVIAAKASEFEAITNENNASASALSSSATFDAHSTVGFYLWNAALAFPLQAATVSALYATDCHVAESLKPEWDSLVSGFSAAVTAYSPRSVALRTMTTCTPTSSSASSTASSSASSAASSSASSIASSSYGTSNSTSAAASTSVASSALGVSTSSKPIDVVTETVVISIESCSDNKCNGTSTAVASSAAAVSTSKAGSAVAGTSTLVKTGTVTVDCSTSSGAAAASAASASAASSSTSVVVPVIAASSATTNVPAAANNAIKYSAGGAAAFACGAIFLL